ncbi:hypothetical protein SEVIR_9G399000v4 [Setaria viridis]|uniref:DUF455 domain-containing protein n=2 Tax=Setaria TaxID=4554 RepID=K4AB78_SETIT|nr:uncharacterized protein LOC101763920 [Setaria italica]XP_034571042.1 uncharacterized protein HI_0077 [Setaria viridis]RCV44708.1 hypothetical protein SETIT_9G396200v2 [Setaria italica]TKV95978.1 hypothetical protein SEVIR_9G399000v2 [Setaria viridis]
MEATADAGGHSSGVPEDQQPPKTLVDWALQILSTADPDEKARLGDLAASLWLCGEIPLPYDPSRPAPPPPDRPARSAEVRLLPPSRMPKLGKGGSAQSRLAMLHSLAHTESWAVDLSWDIIARFGARMRMPREFFDDFARLAQDEGRHYTVLSARLRELGWRYGALPAHDGLWDSAMRTAHCLLARLAVEHCVHEARGLDVLPTTISRFRAGGDEQTAKLLEDIIYPEEVTHCAAGVRWFRYLCLRPCSDDLISYSVPHSEPHCPGMPGDGTADDKTVLEGRNELTSVQQVEDETSKISQDFNSNINMTQQVEDGLANCKLGNNVDKDEAAVIRTFHRIVREYFRGPLKPPFNTEARKAAGFEPAWYEPLAVKEVHVEGKADN